ncbi:MAG: sugar ABC transporter permease [Spirochaetales bacterium]|nr:sugar ABC transporter permease [Spirochaetales bacterium]
MSTVPAASDQATLDPGVDKAIYKKTLKKRIIDNWDLYLFILPAFGLVILFHYFPIYGLQLAFKRFYAAKGIWQSPWVGWRNFRIFLNSPSFELIFFNTLWISLYQLIAGFPAPIILALIFHHTPGRHIKRTVQMVSYAPHFITVVVLVGMMSILLHPNYGPINMVIKAIGGKSIFFMTRPELFKTIYVFSGVWQNVGWGSIIYLAALSSVDPGLHESAIVDGATKLKRIFYIDLPMLAPTVIILLILRFGQLLSVGFEKVFLMQNPLTIRTSEVLATYVYRAGIEQGRIEIGVTVGLFNAVVNFIMLILVNRTAKRFSEHSLF